MPQVLLFPFCKLQGSGLEPLCQLFLWFPPASFGQGVDVKCKVWNAITQLRVKHSSVGFLRFPCMD